MGRTILIVEDYEDARLFMKILLESYGYQVLEAENGAEALECLETHAPDLVLMDISMPVMDGITATKTIRKAETVNHLPIIAVTAHGRQLHKNILDAGCDYLIEKPIDFDEFEMVMHLYLDD
jgi:two-component system, cell cycle response regulator DivK